MFKKPEDRWPDGFTPSESIQAFKAPRVAAPTSPCSVQSTHAVGSASLTASALPGALGALYGSVLSVLSDSAQGAQQLQCLADRGRLSQATLQNLSELTQKPRAAGLDGAALTRETVAILSGPDQNIWQGNRFTCGATNVERQLAEDPERFTALVENLSGLQGKIYLTSGAPLSRVEGSQSDDGSGRNSTDRLIQSSLMAAAGAARGPYEVATDRFANDKDGGGLKIAEIAALTALTQSQPQVVIAYDSKSARATQELLSKLEPGETFQAAMTNWEGKDHMLLLQGCQDGQITYFDPADHAQHTIGMRDFLWKTQFLVLPQAIADRVQFGPESLHSRAEVPYQA
ncbi:hypothetical protein JST97_26885 [bacterium]|nr:hypothetical protein [bacterium]